MNNFLADLLGLINGVLALIVVLLGAGAGAYYGQDQSTLSLIQWGRY